MQARWAPRPHWSGGKPVYRCIERVLVWSSEVCKGLNGDLIRDLVGTTFSGEVFFMGLSEGREILATAKRIHISAGDISSYTERSGARNTEGAIDEQIREFNSLTAGEWVLLSGVIYTARDAAHKRLVQCVQEGKKLPFNPYGAVIYYAGPCPAKPGSVIGSVGPTTSSRMDTYTPVLLKLGVKGMIGKGRRSREVREAAVRYGAVYFVTVGGAGALLSKRVLKSEILAYPDLGPEAIFRLEVKDFPAVVAIDTRGNDIYDNLA